MLNISSVETNGRYYRTLLLFLYINKNYTCYVFESVEHAMCSNIKINLQKMHTLK